MTESSEGISDVQVSKLPKRKSKTHRGPRGGAAKAALATTLALSGFAGGAVGNSAFHALESSHGQATGQTTESGNPIINTIFNRAEVTKNFNITRVEKSDDGHSQLIFATRDGLTDLFVSTDGGATMMPVVSNVFDATWYPDPTNHQQDPLFAVMYNLGSPSNPKDHIALFKFVDGGLKNVAERPCGTQPFHYTGEDGQVKDSFRWETSGSTVRFVVSVHQELTGSISENIDMPPLVAQI